jgi:SAM-dependent methyltransferase
MLDVYGFPSQAFWRSFEVDVLSTVKLERPILELGCSDGAFSRIVCRTVELGIDINPRAVGTARKSGVYIDARLQDARELGNRPEFGSVFANSVLEHIPDLQSVLAGCYRVLRPGGRLVATVPLVDMNPHLLFSSQRWIRYRQGRLSHVNLWTIEQWREALDKVGFDIERTQRYLSPGQIRLWDTMDSIAVVGSRRINVGSIAHKVVPLLPALLRKRINAWYCNALGHRLQNEGSENGCCALIIAVKH